jgi:hypothetical protein
MSKVLNIAGAVVAGAAGFQEGQSQRKDAQARQATQAQALKESEARIARQPSVDQAQEKIDIEMNKLRADNQKMMGEQAQDSLNRAISISDVNGEYGHVMDVLKNNEHFSKIYAPLAGMEPMNIGNDADLRLLDNARQEILLKEAEESKVPGEPERTEVGPPEENLEAMAKFWQDRPELLKQHVKTIGTNGTSDVMDMRVFKARNLYYAGKNNDEIKEEIDKVKLEQNKLKLERTKKGLASTPTREESDIQTLATLTDKPKEEVGAAFFQKKIAGVSAGKADVANETTIQLHEKFGGEDKFFETDFSDPKNKRTAAADIRKIVELTGGLSKSDEKELRQAGELMSLASSVSGGLTEESAGMVDNLVNTGRDLFFSNVVDAKRQAAEASYRQFKSNIEKIQANLQVLSDYKDPTLAHYYTSSSQEKVNKVLGELDTILVSLGADPEAFKSEEEKKATAKTASQDRFNKFFKKGAK